MKIRNGFVSNSSSSSFVLIGCKLTENEIANKLNINVNDVWKKVKEIDLFWSSENDIIGYLVADDIEIDYDGTEMSMVYVMEKANLVSKKLSIPIEDVKLITGARSC